MMYLLNNGVLYKIKTIILPSILLLAKAIYIMLKVI
jgi:hypothetical protein